MRQGFTQLSVATRGKGFYEITAQIQAWVIEQTISNGVLTVFIRHTSASLMIQENADPDVTRDLEAYFSRLVPENDPLYIHTTEGPDDMPAHVRSALTQISLSIPIIGGRMVLGTWQGIYVFEHRRHAHKRGVVLHLIGE